MRAVAVLLVVLFHSGVDDNLMGSAGVTVFFTISGFVITNLVLREALGSAGNSTAGESVGGFRIGRFYARRALKLGPPLLVAVVLPSVIYGFVSGWTKVDPFKLFAMIGFFFNAVKIDLGEEGIIPGTVVVWSLSVEEQFYLGFAIVWLLLLKFLALKRARLVLGWLAALAVAYSFIASFIMVVVSHGALIPRVYFGTDTRMGAIALGVLVALLYRTDAFRNFHIDYLQARNRVARLVIDVIFLTVVLLFIYSLHNGTLAETHIVMPFVHSLVSGCALIYGFLTADSRGALARGFRLMAGWKPLQLVGRASYSIYLVHYPLIMLMRGWWNGYHTWWEELLGVAVSLLAGLLLWRVVEVPIERLKAKRFVG